MNIGNRYSVVESPRSGAALTPAREKGEGSSTPKGNDDVDISPEMRGAFGRLNGESRVDPELKALLRTTITEQRASDVLQKVNVGYYRQPLVVKHVASAVAAAISGRV
jgi:hypothetical protein